MHNSTSLDDICTPELRFDIYIAGWITAGEGILAILLNGTLITLLLLRKKESNHAFLLLNLAITDTTVALFHDFPRMVQYHYSWTFGIELCIVFQVTQQISLYASTYMLVVLSVDRLLAIITPLSPKRHKRWYRPIMIFIPWFLATIFSLPYLKSVVLQSCGDLENEVKLWCIVDFRGQYGNVMVPFIVALLIVLPAILMMSIYGYIFYFVRKRYYKDETTNINENKCVLRSNQRQSLGGAMKRSLLITFVVCLAFILCWLPSTLATFIAWAGIDLKLGGAFHIMQALRPLNSCVNPIIIFAFNYKIFKTDHSQDSRHTLITILSLRRRDR